MPAREGNNARRQTRQTKEPVEDVRAGGDDIDVGNRAEEEDGDDGPQRSPAFVDIGEKAGRVAAFGKGSEGSRTGVNTGETDREDGYADGDVDEIWAGVSAQLLDRQGQEPSHGQVLVRQHWQRPAQRAKRQRRHHQADEARRKG